MTERLKTDLGIEYYLIKPHTFKVCVSPTEFFCLKPNKRKFVKDNIAVVKGEYLVYSPHTSRYYYRVVHDYTNPYEQSSLMSLINQRRVYIQYSPESRTNISAHYKQLGLKYGAFVRHNELTLELEEWENNHRYEKGFNSHVRRITQELLKLKNHAQASSNHRGVSTEVEEDDGQPDTEQGTGTHNKETDNID